MSDFQYKKSRKYTDYDEIYAQCSGPGGLDLAEFLAEKMGVTKGKLLLDIGTNRGYQTCFLAKEYGVFAVGIDPWNDRMKGNPHVEHLRDNAKKWGVENSVLGIQVGVPETFFASESFDYVYSTTTLEMIRGSQGIIGYKKSLEEIHRVLKSGGIFGLAEPMHLENGIPIELDPYISKGEYSWKECFRSLRETISEVKEAGFKIIEADYAPDAWRWWEEFVIHDPFCKSDPDDDPIILEVDQGRWTSFGYIIAKKE